MTTGRRIYLACVNKNLSVKTVAELSGLPEEKVEAIITKNEKNPRRKTFLVCKSARLNSF